MIFKAYHEKNGQSHRDEVIVPDSAHGTNPCLLYTSDAADDMQCVDLGGRRIIKKKKHESKRGGRDARKHKKTEYK
ncbi:putative glycine dehydrogenase (decarboxylating) subunit 2 [Clostridioides difficile]|nr:putative glycine dehydrogenase (decarboxylating) subunit 2 [Clostridioides difficile]